MNEEKTKSFAVSKRMVYNSYQKVCDKNGSAGIDKETIDKFNEDLSSNLYKVWNRMASGSYFPPAVRTVLIPKKQGGTRPLGIPTVGDRILEELLPEGKEMAKTTKERLLQKGFLFKYVTHLFTNKEGMIYYYCYDYGYLPLD